MVTDGHYHQGGRPEWGGLLVLYHRPLRTNLPTVVTKGILLVPILIGAGSLGAQPDVKVTTGVVHYQQGEFDKAIEALDLALEDVTLLQDKNVPKAYYYRALALKQRYAKALNEKDAEWINTHIDCWLQIYGDLVEARKADDGTWEGRISPELEIAYGQLVRIGLAQLNTYNDFGRTEVLPSAIEHFRCASLIQPNDYVAKDLLAQAYLAHKDSVNAAMHFDLASMAFKAHPPEQPDLLIAYVYYRLALLDRYYYRVINKALDRIHEGQAVLEKEWARVQDAGAVSGKRSQYENAVADLRSFELDCYLNAPHKLHEAIPRFRQACAVDPNNYNIHVALASLFERESPDSAVVWYKKAIAIDSTRQHAWFNLGAVYNNMASELFQAANASDDYAEIERLNGEIDDLFRKAMPCFEHAYGIDPGDASSFQALKQIYARLDLMDKYNALVGE
jgi:tetratricopeptide (TPR) repeat protein